MNQIDVFPDTNIFLHYPSPEQIDWKALTGMDSVRLVLCLEVIRELDDKKSHPTLSGRAGQAIKAIREADASRAEIRPGVTLTIYSQGIRHSEFPQSLSPDEGDDRIVHLAQKYKEQNPDRAVAIVTEDLGMEVRCKASDMPVVAIDKSLRLENPQDEVSKKLKQAQQELTAYKNKQPKLELTASNHTTGAGSGAPVFELERKWPRLDIEKEMEGIVKAVPKHTIQPPSSPSKDEAQPSVSDAYQRLMATFGVSEEQWREYNKKIDEYRKEYRDHFELQNVKIDAAERLLVIDFDLANHGTCTATDIDVVLSFPEDVVNVFESGSDEAKLLQNPLPAPVPPKKPEGGLADVLGRFDPIGNRGFEFPDLEIGDDYTPSVSCNRKDVGCEINGHLKKLKHGHSVRLGTFLAIVGDLDKCRPFNISCRITSSDVPEVINRTIPIVVRKAPSQ